jgi:hypothetical protein
VILVDTSVWIDHFRRGNTALVEALEREDVLVHPFVIGEIACGELKKRREILELLAALPSAIVASDEEALELIERRRLMGKGIGYADVHLLASAALTEGARLWTLDIRLAPFAGGAPGS